MRRRKLARLDPLAWLLACVLALLLGWSAETPAATGPGDSNAHERQGLAVAATKTAIESATPLTRRTLDLHGYADAQGAIRVLRGGDQVDPYFALQALLLARDHGLDVQALQARWIAWIAEHQQPVGVLARYCPAPRRPGGWRACARADADDASLALWLRLLRGVPAAQRQALQVDALQAEAEVALARLRDARTGLYHVSPDLPYSLWMDNLEVWSALPSRALSEALLRHFWQPQAQRFRVSTQRLHVDMPGRFYPEATAQIFPLLVGWPAPGGPGFEALATDPALRAALDPGQLYARWMQAHRAQWLAQMAHDYPWGLLALLAWQQGDLHTVRCWQQRTVHLRHGARWTVTDEVVAQLLPPLSDPPLLLKDCQ